MAKKSAAKPAKMAKPVKLPIAPASANGKKKGATAIVIVIGHKGKK
jgi:hypothetical protein